MEFLAHSPERDFRVQHNDHSDVLCRAACEVARVVCSVCAQRVVCVCVCLDVVVVAVELRR